MSILWGCYRKKRSGNKVGVQVRRIAGSIHLGKQVDIAASLSPLVRSATQFEIFMHGMSPLCNSDTVLCSESWRIERIDYGYR